MVDRIDKGASFSPWHGLAAHRPLGAINRIRKPVYEASAEFRLRRNGCPFHSTPDGAACEPGCRLMLAGARARASLRLMAPENSQQGWPPGDDPDNALRDSEVRFRALVTAGAFSIYRMSPDWKLMYQLTSPDVLTDTPEPISDWVEKYIPAEDLPAVNAAIAEAIRTRSMFELEHRVFGAGGNIVWVISRAVPILGPDGEIKEWFGAGSDVTARKRAEIALRESEAIRAVALAGGGMGAWRWDLANRLVGGDAQFLALWGFPPSDAPHPLTDFTARMSPQSVIDTEIDVTKAIAANEEFDAAVEIASGPTGGHTLRWRGRASPGDTAILYGVSFDITEQRQAELRLRESEAQQAFLLDLTDALRPLTDSGEIERRATRLLGEYLKADRCFLSPVYEDGLGMCVREEYLREGASSVLGDYTFAQFGDFVGPALHADRIWRLKMLEVFR